MELAPNLAQRLTDDMKAALRAGDKERLSVIRMMLSDVRNIDLDPKKPTAEQVVAGYAKKLRKSLDEYEKIGRTEEVAKLRFEIGIAESYLPKKASSDETAALVDQFLSSNAFTEKQLGQAMGAFMKQYGAGTENPVDPAIANPLLKQKLAGK